MTPIEKLAVPIKRLRERKGWTQEMLAEKTSVGRSYLARLETARQDRTLGTLEKLAKALGVTVSQLV